MNNKKTPHQKSFSISVMVAQVRLHWNQICNEIIRWRELYTGGAGLQTTPAHY